MVTQCKAPLAVLGNCDLTFIVIVVYFNKPAAFDEIRVGFLVFLFIDINAVFINTDGFCEKL